MDILTLTSIIVAFITTVASGAFYVKNQANKGNMDGKDATIETLTRQRDATNDENILLRSRVAELTGENKTLKALATQTPEIIKLTESVTHLTESVTTQGKQTTKMLSTTVRLLRNLANREQKVAEEELMNE